MVQYKGEFFIKGVNGQRRPDLVLSIKLPEKSKREKWTSFERRKVLDWIKDQELVLIRFVNDL